VKLYVYDGCVKLVLMCCDLVDCNLDGFHSFVVCSSLCTNSVFMTILYATELCFYELFCVFLDLIETCSTSWARPRRIY
jgi:hypothetical protein